MNIITNRVKRKFFPTQHQLIVKKWYANEDESKLRCNYNLNSESMILDLWGYQGQ